ncbi:hypothetical protein [Companilactobacillus muriivasis]|uniref:hypothetical protein n=1 Tax=Companilactobacillus muriivasis TaxID=3081444 RepID=UPI0030C6F19F
MNEITILKEDMDVFKELGSGWPYKEWLKENNLSGDIHTAAQYILREENHWNTWFTKWVAANCHWLVKVRDDGYTIRVINKVITLASIGYSDNEEAILSSKPLNYEHGEVIDE